MQSIRAHFAAAVTLLVITAMGPQAFAQDTCGTATVISGLPSTLALDTTAVTSDPGNPPLSCGGASEATVWYTYTASGPTTLLLDTTGSDYETGIGVYSGGCGALAEIACSDDFDFDGDTQVALPVAAGETIHIMVAGAFSGGNLTLKASKAPFDATPPVSAQAAVTAGTPTPLGGSFASFSRAIALSKTDVAFTGATDGIFVHDGSTTTTVAVSGDATPVGGTFVNLGQPMGAAGETVAFWSTVLGGTSDNGIFLYSAGSLSAAVVQGDPAPGGGFFDNFTSGLAINPSGTAIAFIADTTLSGSEALYLYVVGTGVVGPLLREQIDPSPCGGTVMSFGNAAPVMAINDALQVVLFARSSGPSRDGVYRYNGVGWGAVACEDGPTPLGGTYRAINRNVRIADTGLAFFHSTVTLPGPDTQALFYGSAAPAFVLAQDNELLLTGETIADFPGVPVVTLSSGTGFAFQARTTAGDAIVAGAPGALSTILIEGATCPAGGIIAVLDSWIAADPSTGAVAFAAACTGGRGIFEIPAGGGAVQTIALHTYAAPVGAGFGFDDPTSSGGSIAFEGMRTGVYRVSCDDSLGCDPVTTVAAPLTAAPGLAGEVLTTIDPDMLAGQGDLIAFGVTTTGAARRGAIMASSAGTLALVAAEGIALPGTTFEPFDVLFGGIGTLIPAPFGADKRGVGFVAGISDTADPFSTVDSGVFLWRSGTVSTIALADGPTPDGYIYSRFDTPLVRGSRVYFHAETTGSDCFFRGTTGSTRTLSCTGAALPVPPGGTISFIEGDVPGLGTGGPVFRASVNGGSASECLLTPKGSGTTPVACERDLLPNGGAAGDFPSGLIAASRRRVVAFTTDVNFNFNGLFHFGKRARARIARDGIATPIGGTYLLVDPRPSISGKTVVFLSDVEGGTARQAIFSAILRR